MAGNRPEEVAEDSILTNDMVIEYAHAMSVELTAEARPGLIGTLVDLEAGRGTFPEALKANETLAPLLAAWEAKRPKEDAPAADPAATPAA